MRSVRPGVAGRVFMLCFTSFAVVLTLGGGPKATTLEVAVYQALRFDFDLGRAVTLALVQLLLCTAIVLAVLQLAVPSTTPLTEGRLYPRPDSRSEEHTSELQSLMRISYAVFCLKKNKHNPP